MTGIFTFFLLLEINTTACTNDLFDVSLLVTLLSKSTSVLPSLYLCLSVFVFTFFIAQWFIPQSIRFANRFQLMDHPNTRKTHLKPTPILGGVSIFISVIFALALTVSFLFVNSFSIDINFKRIFGLFSAVSLMVFFGLKDDIFDVSPLEKVVFQIITALFVIISCEVRIESFDGLFGVYELSTFFSYVFSVFVFVTVVNAFNLIDGIDGLSASVGLVSTLCFGLFFFLNDLVTQSVIMFCYSGALVSFLIFNFKKRLFLGDNGSMSLGVVIAFGVFSVITTTNELNPVERTGYFIHNSSVIILALISFPLLDTIRVFCVRLKQGKNPFSPDRNHLHHHLIRLKLSHFESTFLVVTYTLILTSVALALNSWNITSHFFVVLLLSSFIYLISWASKKKHRKYNK